VGKSSRSSAEKCDPAPKEDHNIHERAQVDGILPDQSLKKSSY
jgi:hypothetical protein